MWLKLNSVSNHLVAILHFREAVPLLFAPDSLLSISNQNIVIVLQHTHTTHLAYTHTRARALFLP